MLSKFLGLKILKLILNHLKKPNFLNALVYGYIRKSKAERSFEYAQILLRKNIGTPQPYAFYEKKTLLGLSESYYFSEQQDIDLMFRNLIFDPNYPNRVEIIKQSANFFYKIHNLGIEFIDNTAGNILITKVGENEYNFYLVDLNRMIFHKIGMHDDIAINFYDVFIFSLSNRFIHDFWLLIAIIFMPNVN